MTSLYKFMYKNFDYIILCVLIIFTIILLVSILELKFDLKKTYNENKNPDKIINIETMDNKDNNNELSLSFCNNYEHDHIKLKSKSKNLNFDACNSTRCTVWVNNDNKGKCYAGDEHGPHFHGTLENPLKIDNYYYKNTCYMVNKKCK